MENIIQFVNSILPDQEKTNILEKIESTRSEISKITLPAYEQLLGYSKESELNSALFTEFSKGAGRYCHNSNGRNIVVDIKKALETHDQNLNKMYDLVDKYRANVITVESITYKRANVLILISAIDGFVRYCTRLCGLLWLAESGVVKSESIYETKLPEYSFLVRHRAAFYSTLEVGLRDPKKLMSTINNLPDLTVSDENGEMVKMTMGNRKDETIVKNFTVAFSPILYIRRLAEDFQERRLDRLKTEKKWLEACRANAEIARDTGESNAAIEKRIDYYSGKLETVDRKLAELSNSPE